MTWAGFPFFSNQSLQFLYNSHTLYLKLESIRMCTSAVLLLCQLCGSNASISVESRNNILLSQLLFFSFFFSLPPPPQSSVPFSTDGISWRQSNVLFHSKSSTCSIEHEKVVLSKTKFPPVASENAVLFCLGKEAGPLLDVSYENSNLHSVHSPCLWCLLLPMFVDFFWVSHCNCWHSALKWWKTQKAYRGVIEMGAESLPDPAAFCTVKKPITSLCSWLQYLTSTAQWV